MPGRRQITGQEKGRESEETKRQLLHTACRLFLHEGYHMVSTRQITDACGLTHPALYHYFSGKEDLYITMLMDELSRLRAVLERLAQRDERPVQERIRRIILFLLTTTDYNFPLMLHDIESALSPLAQETLGTAFNISIIEPLATLFTEGQQHRQIRDFTPDGLDAPGLAAFLLSLVAHFLSTHLPITPPSNRSNHTSSAITTDLIMHLLFQGISPPPTSSSKLDDHGEEM